MVRILSCDYVKNLQTTVHQEIHFWSNVMEFHVEESTMFKFPQRNFHILFLLLERLGKLKSDSDEHGTVQNVCSNFVPVSYTKDISFLQIY
jgi:hypothetical protein